MAPTTPLTNFFYFIISISGGKSSLSLLARLPPLIFILHLFCFLLFSKSFNATFLTADMRFGSNCHHQNYYCFADRCSLSADRLVLYP